MIFVAHGGDPTVVINVRLQARTPPRTPARMRHLASAALLRLDCLGLIGTLMRQRHGAKMRYTVDLPHDLHRIVAALAVPTRRSLSLTRSNWIHRRSASAATTEASRGAAMVTSSKTGLPLICLPRTVTPEGVKALEDEA